MAAFIAYYPLRCCEARLTRVAAAPTTVIPVPPMAHAVLPIVDDTDGATLRFASDLGGTVPLYGPVTYPAGTTPLNRSLKVPPGAASLVVTTTAAAMPIAFELSM